MNPACTSCQAAEKSPKHSGQYNFYCAACMARLIVAARPSKEMQQRQIDALARFHRAAWPELFEKVKQELKEIKK